MSQHIKCLSEFFDVTLIDHDCDYREVCDTYQPDVALFESGAYVGGKREILNTSAYPEIPKIGFCDCDAYCETRIVFLSDMERWGVDTFFTHSTSMAEYTPEIAGKLFVWPNFADVDLYRDYGESKIIPMLFNGSQAPHYPWRRQMYAIASRFYPILTCPHFGWFDERRSERMVVGEQYARMLNASWMVPTCGTIAKELVRKYFEIPACKSCLVTERTPAAEAAGFVDMKNCVFTDETDVTEKLDYLFQHMDELERIIEAGHQLVNSRHTLKQRDQLFQWFNLNKTLKAGQIIVQAGPFDPLTLVEKTSGIKNSHIFNGGLDRVLIRRGDECLFSGKYDEAEALYIKSLNYHNIPEPKLGLTLLNLYKGKPDQALYWITQPISSALEKFDALDADPVEWAYFIISLLCQGRLTDAIQRANQFPALCHPELDRARLVVGVLNDNLPRKIIYNLDESKIRNSVHQLPKLSLNEWVLEICGMLKACKQLGASIKLSNSILSENKSSPEVVFTMILPKTHKAPVSASNAAAILPINSESCHVLLSRWIKSNIKTPIISILHALETKFGYFLPYRFSKIKTDEFCFAIQQLLAENDFETALIIGAAAGERSTEAFLAGVQENPKKPIVFCVNNLNDKFIKLKKRYVSNSLVKCIDCSIEDIKRENKIDCFDIILIDASQLTHATEYKEIYGARFIVLDDINLLENHKQYRKLVEDNKYMIVAQNYFYQNGYAIFKKISGSVRVVAAGLISLVLNIS